MSHQNKSPASILGYNEIAGHREHFFSPGSPQELCKIIKSCAFVANNRTKRKKNTNGGDRKQHAFIIQLA